MLLCGHAFLSTTRPDMGSKAERDRAYFQKRLKAGEFEINSSLCQTTSSFQLTTYKLLLQPLLYLPKARFHCTNSNLHIQTRCRKPAWTIELPRGCTSLGTLHTSTSTSTSRPIRIPDIRRPSLSCLTVEYCTSLIAWICRRSSI